MTQKFIYRKNIFLKDLTIYGNTYFANYIEWQGEAREALLAAIVTDTSFLNKIKLVTISAGIKFRGEAVYGDQICIEVAPTKITLTSVELDFIYRKGKDDRLIAEGHQRIGFTDMDGNVLPLPRDLLINGKNFLTTELLDQVKVLEKKISWISEHTDH
jgi:enediyne core biosynthesis thioesterase